MSKKKPNLLIIDVNPFGYLTDTVKWIEYLRNDWQISLVCFRSKDSEDNRPLGVRFIELPNTRIRSIKGFIFILFCIWILLLNRGKVMVEYFPYCEIFKKLFPSKRMLLDVRTLAVNPDDEARKKANNRIRIACNEYDVVSVISKGVGEELGLKKYYILPLGSDVISSQRKIYTNAINLLYVGTLNNRGIDKTIIGVKDFVCKNPDIPLNYIIIGFGTYAVEKQIRELIQDNYLENNIQFVGKVKHSALHQYFDTANVGISFVPITPYFNFQPPTKTFEYCLSGLFCIATNTYANAEVIDNSNGLLIDDTSDSFCNGLEKYWNKRLEIKYEQVSQSLKDYSWKCIIKDSLHPILSDL